MTKVETARNLALAVLEDVFVNQAYSNIALNKHLKGSQLLAVDKSLVTELVYGTVARKLTLEWYLSHFIEDRDPVRQLALCSASYEYLPAPLFGQDSRPCCGQ